MTTSAVTVAIDFGTTYSGYVYSFRGDQDKFYMPTWQMKSHLSRKTPTAVLTEIISNNDHKFVAFGYEAQQTYSDRKSEPNLSKKTCLFNRFKMVLHREKVITPSTTITDSTGKHKIKALKIFSMSLEYLKNHCLNDLKEVTSKQCSSREIQVDDITWVLTVPAIWSDRAKMFMRKAAFEAGLIPEEMSQRLVIALEPESASYFCRKTETHNFAVKTGGDLVLPEGAIYMVLDAGGGTIDITMHRVTKERKIEEVRAPSGGDWGGTQVDGQFLQMMKKVLGSRFMEHCKTELPLVWLDLETDLEFNKRNAKPDVDEPLVVTRVSWELGDSYQEFANKSLQSVFKEATAVNQGIGLSRGNVTFDSNARADLFNPTISKIVRHVRELLRDTALQSLSHIFMVGGFAQSAYLQKAIVDNFKYSAKIYTPHDPELAVLKGAVMFGHNPGEITSRVARRTYGTESNDTFVPGKHREDLKTIINGVEHCSKIFSVFVQKGEMVKKGQVKTFTYFPLKPDQTAVAFPMIAADSDTVKYSDAPNVEQLGKTTLDMPDTTQGTNRPIQVSVQFCGTEIDITMEDISCRGGDKKKCKLQFHSV